MNNYANYYSQRRVPQTATMQTPSVIKELLQKRQFGFGGSRLPQARLPNASTGSGSSIPSRGEEGGRPPGFTIGHTGPGSWPGQPGYEQYKNNLTPIVPNQPMGPNQFRLPDGTIGTRHSSNSSPFSQLFRQMNRGEGDTSSLNGLLMALLSQQFGGTGLGGFFGGQRGVMRQPPQQPYPQMQLDSFTPRQLY